MYKHKIYYKLTDKVPQTAHQLLEHYKLTFNFKKYFKSHTSSGDKKHPKAAMTYSKQFTVISPFNTGCGSEPNCDIFLKRN